MHMPTSVEEFLLGLLQRHGSELLEGHAPSRRIITGKLYDTRQSRLIGQFIHTSEDGQHTDERLYMASSGRYFLIFEGYGSAVYLNDDVDRFSGHLLPMSDDDAMEWLELRNLTDEYIKAFGEPEVV